MTVAGEGGQGAGRLGIAAVRLLLVLVFALLTSMASVPARAETADVEIQLEETYGRLVVGFPDRNILPPYKVSSDNGVLVLRFEEAVEMDVSRVPSVLGRFVTIARADPENRGARFALARSVTVNAMEAGSKLFLDFLPPNWQGPPPRLPDEVIAELGRRAEEAERRAREAELLKIAGSKAAKLDLRVARSPTFSRFVFKWNIPFEAEFQRQDSGVSVSFNRTAPVDLSAIRADMPPFVDDIAEESDENGVRILLSIQPAADVRAFREEDTYVVDVQGPIDPSALTPLDAAVHSASGDGHEVPHGATEQVHAPGIPAEAAHGAADAHAAPAADHAADDHAAPADTHAAPADTHAAPAAVQTAVDHTAPAVEHPAPEAHAAPAAEPAADAHAAPAADHAAAGDHAAPSAAHAPADGHAAPADGHSAPEAEHAAADDHAVPQPAHAADPHAAPADEVVDVVADHGGTVPATEQLAELPDGANDRVLADDLVRVEAKRIGSSTRLTFPYDRPIGSALFTRGPALWLVFDDPAPIDPAPLQDALAGFARAIEFQKVGEAQAIRIELAEPLLATLNPDGTFWTVTIGDMVMAPTRPLPIKRSVDQDGQVSLDVPFGPVAAMHAVPDPSVGDTIQVITGEGQPRGLIKPQTFSELDALSSAHGLAFVPKVDDLQIKAEGELVSIRRPGGLSVSAGIPQKRASLLDLPASIGSSLGGSRPGFVDFTDAEASDPPDFWAKRHELMNQLAQTRDKAERIDRWYKTAKFNVANGLGPEAIGVLNLIASIAPEEATSERMAMLRAAGSLLMHRPKEAMQLLERPELAESPDAAVWRTIALAELGEEAEARKYLPRAEAVIGSFPRPVQKRFLLAGVAIALELNDYGKARSLLSEIDPRALTPDEIAELDLLNARAIDAGGHAGDAIGLLSNIVRTGRGPVAAEATYRLVKLQRREGLITLDQAIDRLEQLAVAWRGDEIELNTLRSLGQLSVEKGNYRRAFEVMRTALQIGPDAPVTRLMQDEMQAAFASLYLDGKADEMRPVDALALYYDFRELTPPGRRGDAMVRKLADRLVDVDLLPQAQQLLTYQVENRLRGAARAQVAADLALIYLLDKRPDRALLTLSRTRQSELPAGIERQRRTVEARALADTGKPELALDLLKPLKGGDIERLRAEILWENDRHQQAGEQFERLLGGRWADDLPLSDLEQLQVLKAGIAYTLADDRIGIDRLRSKYAGKMAGTPSGTAFEAVTGPVTVTEGAGFDDVVRSIAAIDTMDAFLDDYRRRYLELGTGEKPEVLDGGGAPSEAAPAEGGEPAPSAENRAAPAPGNAAG
jgi:tetratricopeptide (TPR) repeat protein